MARGLLEAWAKDEPEGLASTPGEWNAESGTVGMMARVGADSELLTGTVEGVGDDGALILGLVDGKRRTFVSGHVELME